LRNLGRFAIERRLGSVRLHYVESGKNRPAMEFLRKIARYYSEAILEHDALTLSAPIAAQVSFLSALKPNPSTEASVAAPRTGIPPSCNRQLRNLAIELARGDPLRGPYDVITARRVRRKRDPGSSLKIPQTPLEEILVRRWAEVLGVDKVGVEEDFFELGGHSLMGTVMLSRVQRDVQCDIPLRLLFDHPTIEQLGMAIEQRLLGSQNTESAALAELEGLTEEELDAMIASERQSLEQRDINTS